jgi:hypothetical protein
MNKKRASERGLHFFRMSLMMPHHGEQEEEVFIHSFISYLLIYYQYYYDTNVVSLFISHFSFSNLNGGEQKEKKTFV